jgi:serine/threonine protein kinase
MITNPSTPSTSIGKKTPMRRVGRFTVTEKLGKGSNGTVFLGHDPVIDRPVAIKILGAAIGVADKKQQEQHFINEARAAGRLSHPNIVTIFDASSEGGTTFIAMEFLQGQDLRELMASGKRFDIIEISNIVCKVAEALAYAHEHGVIHRDIKPANIFILANNQPKVVDFGIARAPNRVLENENGSEHTIFNNNIMGTPNYMSPEQAMGKPVNALTDVYSLGALMYEMLTLQKPFHSHDIDKLLHQIANKNPKSPSEISPKIPEKLSQIVMKAMHKDPVMRYLSAAEMALALNKFLARDKRLKRKRLQNMQGSNHVSTKTSEKSAVFWLSVFLLLVAVGAVIITLRR